MSVQEPAPISDFRASEVHPAGCTISLMLILDYEEKPKRF